MSSLLARVSKEGFLEDAPPGPCLRSEEDRARHGRQKQRRRGTVTALQTRGRLFIVAQP